MSFTISIDDIVHSTLDFVNLCHLVSAKGQLISKGLFGVIVSTKNNYRKVASSSLSRLVTYFWIFRLHIYEGEI